MGLEYLLNEYMSAGEEGSDQAVRRDGMHKNGTLDVVGTSQNDVRRQQGIDQARYLI